MSRPSVRMTPGYPSDTGSVCLSAPHYPRHQVCLSSTVSPTSPRTQLLTRSSQSYPQVLDSPGSLVTSSNTDQTHSNTMSQTRQSDNIGSIITMLISDQSVDLEDYLSDPALRQEERETEMDREEMDREVMDRVVLDREQLLQADVKEETLSEAVVPTVPQYCQEFDYYNPEFLQHGPGKSRSSSRSEGDEENCQYRYQQPSPAYSTISYCKSGYSPLLDMSNYTARRGSGLATPALDTGEQRFGESEKKDDKYWERRRKNNLAAKKSRDSRRVRENQLRLRVLCLENANRVLREQMDRKEGELGHIRERLNKYESIENCKTNYL